MRSFFLYSEESFCYFVRDCFFLDSELINKIRVVEFLPFFFFHTRGVYLFIYKSRSDLKLVVSGVSWNN